MGIVVCGEKMGDEGAIEAVNCRAFASADEAQIVSDMRGLSPTYDRRFSVGFSGWAPQLLPAPRLSRLFWLGAYKSRRGEVARAGNRIGCGLV